jgi:hypothetical protein
MAYEVPIDPKSLELIASLLEKSAKNAEALSRGVDKVNGSLRGTQTAGGRMVALEENPVDRARRGSRGQQVGPSSSTQPWRGGSRTRLAQEEESLRRAEAVGDADLIRDQKAKVRRAQRRVASDDRLLDDSPAKAKTQEDLIREMIMTSRVLPNGQLSPLVNKLIAAGGTLKTPDGSTGAAQSLQALGIGDGKTLAPAIANAAKTVLPIIAGAAAGIGVFALAEAGDRRTRQGNAAFYTMGGTPGSASQALALGGENAAQKAVQLGDRLRESTYGAGYLRSRGIVDMGSATVDKGTNYIRSLDALRGISDVNQRIRVARDTNLTDDLWTSDLSPSSYESLKNSRSAAGSVGRRKDSAEFNALKENAGNGAGSFLEWLGEGARGLVLDTKALLWDLPSGIAGDKEGVQQSKDALDMLNRHWNPWYQDAQDKKATQNGGMGFQNVDRVMSGQAETINGSMDGVMPAGWRGSTMGSMIRDQSQYLGSFGL